jgi:uncharacterized protein
MVPYFIYLSPYAGEKSPIKIKSITLLSALTFIFLLTSSSVIFADDFQDGVDAYNRKDYKTAYQLWLPIAEQGDAEAQYNLGVMYDDGTGVLQDYKEAVRLFRLSAEQGNIGAKTNLGWMHDYGYGVHQDHKEALRLYRYSAELGNIYAQYNLGVMYGIGEGVSQDDTLAHMWWSLAGSKGHEEATGERVFLEKTMTEPQIQKAKELARNWKPKTI